MGWTSVCWKKTLRLRIQECTFFFAHFMSSPHMLILGAHQCFPFPLKWCKNDFQCASGRSSFAPSLSSLCWRRATGSNHYGYGLINISLRAPQSPRLSHSSLPVLCQFQQWSMPWGWNIHKIQMNQCPIIQALCLWARQSNYCTTWVPLLVLKDKQKKWIYHSFAI